QFSDHFGLGLHPIDFNAQHLFRTISLSSSDTLRRGFVPMSRARKKKPRRRPTEALLLAYLFRLERAEFSQLGRVADLRDEPRFGSDAGNHLLLYRLADWCRPEGNRVTRLGDGDVVLTSVLTEEQALFAIKQTSKVQPAYGHVDF